MKQSMLFVDVDTQVDFMDPGGALYVPGAEEIVPNLAHLTRLAATHGIPLLATLDTHVPDDPEFAEFPPHCLEGTPGWKKIPATDDPRAERFRKHTFDPFTNPEFAERILSLAPRRAVIYGVALDFCVKAAALGLRARVPRVLVVQDAVRAVNAAGAKKAWDALRAAGIRRIDAAGVGRMLEEDGC